MNKLLLLLLSCLLCLLCCTAALSVEIPTFDPDGGSYSNSVTVTMACSTPGSTIWYTTNGNEPIPYQCNSYSSPVTFTSSLTLKAIGWVMGQGYSSTKTATYTISANAVATPTFSPDGGTYYGTQTVTMSCSTSGSAIHYTDNGTNPDGNSATYQSAVSVTATKTLKAIGTKTGMDNSAIKSGSYTILTQCATPTISPAGGTYTSAQNVTLSCATPSAEIRYTTNGNDPTSSSTLYSGAINVNATTTLKAKAFRTDLTDSATASATYTMNVATPTFSPDGGSYYGTQSVTMSCATSGSAIHYTTDGSTPTGSSATYSGAVSVPSTATLKAIGTYSGWTDSAVKSGTYTILTQCATPTFSPAAGTYTTTQTVTLSCATSGATIKYTLDGSTPTSSSATYSAALYVSSTTTVKAIAIKSGLTDSAVGSALYTINSAVATPTFTPDGGTYGGSQSVTIACSTAGSVIKYTTDGTTPSPTNGLTTPNPVTISSSCTLRAIGWVMMLGISPVKIADYTINPTVADPVFSPAAGTYTTPQTVALSCSTTGAAIHYTTNGNDPVDTDPTYESPISLDETTTFKAKAWKTGMAASGVVTATYTINGACATPTFSPAEGTYTSAQTVTISTTTPNAVIRYTTNGTTPTVDSPVYSGAISVTNDTTIKAATFKNGWTTSSVATAAYVINYTLYVNPASSGGVYNGLAWGTAFHTITEALTAAYEGDVIWVAGATYNERITAKSGVAMYAGFAGTETTLDGRDHRINVVTLNGASGGVVITVPQDATAATIIDGFKIQGGGTSTTGGGILINQDADIVVRNCYITTNSATSGAGIYIRNAAPTIANNMILSNTATNGSAIYLEGSPAIIANNTIVTNTASTNGAIYINSGSAPIIANNIIQGNSSGIYNATGTPTLRNNCVYANTGYNYSGVSAGTNDISVNPSFIDAATANYHLNVGSPCVNTGSDTDMYTTKDWDRQDRKNGTSVDIGVDEQYRVANPTIDPNGGSYNAPKPVTLACTTTGASIRYTIDGSDPIITSSEYTGSLSLETSCTVKVRAFKTDYLASDIVSAAFTIIDTAAPITGILNAPEYSAATSFSVSYTGVRDIGDNGLKKVELWYKFSAFGTWTYYATITSSNSTGTFSFTVPANGPGVYYFQLVAEDNGNIRSAAASGEGQDSTIYTNGLGTCSIPAILIPPAP